MKKPVKLLLRIAVSLGLLYFLLSSIDIGNIGGLLASASLPLLAVSMLLVAVIIAISGWRWYNLTPKGLTLKVAVDYTFIGCYFNNFLPTNFGGDGVKIHLLGKRLSSLTAAAVSVFWDRYTGLAGLVLAGAIGYVAAYHRLRDTPLTWVYPAALAALILSAALLKTNWIKRLISFLARREFSSQGSPGRGKIFKALTASLVIQIIGSLYIYILALSLSIEVSFIDCLVFCPLANLAAVLPLSISGLGIREGAMVYLFGLSGVPKEEALLLSLAGFAVMLIVSLWGGVVYVKRDGETKSKTTT
ncbi:MAG: hypothetical protein C0609_12840 [Deltaproteobacteria bacterium]|nr:MAG: hypothetical protein C0609_12840 [Deltaproteobacteria bacterium]